MYILEFSIFLKYYIIRFWNPILFFQFFLNNHTETSAGWNLDFLIFWNFLKELMLYLPLICESSTKLICGYHKIGYPYGYFRPEPIKLLELHVVYFMFNVVHNSTSEWDAIWGYFRETTTYACWVSRVWKWILVKLVIVT